MNDELVTQRYVDRTRAAALVGRAAIGGDRVDMNRLFGHAAGNALVNDVDHAADRRRAEQQRLGTAQHLDAFGQQRVDHGSMIDAGVGHVDRADAIDQDTDALPLKPAQNRAGRAGTKGGRGHAGRMLERFANRRPDGLGQLAALKHRRAREDVGPITLERRSHDDVGRGLFVRSRCG